VRVKLLLFAERVVEKTEFPREKSHNSKTDKGLRFAGERRNPDEKSEVPARVMRRPNSRMILQRSQPRPALSGQLTVTMQGSLGSFPCWITTTSSHGIPMTAKWWVQGTTATVKSIAGAQNGGCGTKRTVNETCGRLELH